MYVHLALYIWKPQTTADQVNRALQAIEALGGKISGIIKLRVIGTLQRMEAAIRMSS